MLCLSCNRGVEWTLTLRTGGLFLAAHQNSPCIVPGGACSTFIAADAVRFVLSVSPQMGAKLAGEIDLFMHRVRLKLPGTGEWNTGNPLNR